MFQRSRRNPHLVVVAVLQYHHGDSAGVCSIPDAPCVPAAPLFARSPQPWPGGCAISLWGSCVFPLREAIVRWGVEGVGIQLRRGSCLAPGARCGWGFGRRGDKCVCPGEVRDPYLPLVWLVVVEPPDSSDEDVIWGTSSWGEEHLELPYQDVGRSLWEEGCREAPVGADVVELRSEDSYQVV